MCATLHQFLRSRRSGGQFLSCIIASWSCTIGPVTEVKFIKFSSPSRFGCGKDIYIVRDVLLSWIPGRSTLCCSCQFSPSGPNDHISIINQLSLSILPQCHACASELSEQGFYWDILLYNGWGTCSRDCRHLIIPHLQALQAIALFGLKLNRLPAAIGACAFFAV